MPDKLPDSLPRHLAIIMDGNGRWAESHHLPRVSGHRKGADSVRKIVTACREMGIKVLTLYAFSSQNWSRPSLEINALMSLLANYLRNERDTILSNDIRLTAIGQLDLLPTDSRKALDQLMDESSQNSAMTLCLALSYGGREEIVQMVREIGSQLIDGSKSLDDVTLDLVDQSLWSSDLGPVDLLVRTSGELRLSNFLLWSSAYAEFYFTDKMWPDFDESVLNAAIDSYRSRQRRFGTIESK